MYFDFISGAVIIRIQFAIHVNAVLPVWSSSPGAVISQEGRKQASRGETKPPPLLSSMQECLVEQCKNVLRAVQG